MRRSLIVLLLILMALAFPASGSAAPARPAGDPVKPAIQAAIQWLHTRQAADGSFGVTNSRGVYSPSAAMTADVVYALALAGEDPGGRAWTVSGQSALDALAKLAPGYVGTDAGQAGKVARAVAAACRNPRSFGEKDLDLIGIIQAAYNPVTGRYHPDFLFRHTLAVEALQRAHLPVPAAAYTALINAQLPDGGWFWTFSAAAADVDTTGRVLQVLGRAPQDGSVTGLDAAANFLAGAQAASGGWSVDATGTNVPNANSTGLAVGGLRAIGRDPGAAPFVKGGTSGLQALLAFQEKSGPFAGAFDYIAEPGKEEIRLTATTDALLGLLQAQGELPPSGCSALYLPMLLLH